MKKIYCDESGFDGSNLLNRNDEFYVYVGIELTDREVDAIHRCFLNIGASEIKYTQLTKTKKHSVIEIIEQYSHNIYTVITHKKSGLSIQISNLILYRLIGEYLKDNAVPISDEQLFIAKTWLDRLHLDTVSKNMLLREAKLGYSIYMLPNPRNFSAYLYSECWAECLYFFDLFYTQFKKVKNIISPEDLLKEYKEWSELLIKKIPNLKYLFDKTITEDIKIWYSDPYLLDFSASSVNTFLDMIPKNSIVYLDQSSAIQDVFRDSLTFVDSQEVKGIQIADIVSSYIRDKLNGVDGEYEYINDKINDTGLIPQNTHITSFFNVLRHKAIDLPEEYEIAPFVTRYNDATTWNDIREILNDELHSIWTKFENM